ncbi:MAG: ABC transporter permease [Acidobacteriota bacterium]
MPVFSHDFRSALRSLTRSPGFTALVILTLGLGIGATATLYTVVQGVLLKPLPYPEPDELTMVWTDNRIQGWDRDVTSYPSFLDWRERADRFEHLAAFVAGSYNLTEEDRPERVPGARVSAGFFDTLGSPPVIGRGFLAEEEEPGAPAVTVLSHALWQRRFAGDPEVVGTQIPLNGTPTTVVGVLAPQVAFPQRTEIYVPLAPREPFRSARGMLWLQVLGRQADGVEPGQAQEQMETIFAALEENFPRFYRERAPNLVPLLDEVVGDIRQPLAVMLGAVALLLLIACANVANLMLTRATVQQREVALRSALGAGRGAQIRRFLAESLLLAAGGAVVGAAFAAVGVRALRAAAPATLPRIDEIAVDGGVLLFCAAVAALTGLLFGIVPAFQGTRVQLTTLLKADTGSRRAPGARLRAGLVITEIALALVVLLAAGLLGESLRRLAAVDPGFTADDRIALRVELPRRDYPDESQRRAFRQALLERARALPGVRSATVASALLPGPGFQSAPIGIQGQPPLPPEENIEVTFVSVGPEFFSTLDIPLSQGRSLSTGDDAEAPPVVVVNEALARRYFDSDLPLGSALKIGGHDSPEPWSEIVGVVGNLRTSGPDQPARPGLYRPMAQNPTRSFTLFAEVEGASVPAMDGLRAAVRDLDPTLPVVRLEPVERALEEQLGAERFQSLLLSLFALLALALTAIGIYGVVSYSVSQNSREIGIRMSLGSQRRQVLWMVVQRTLGLAALGVVGGIALATLTNRSLSKLLHGVGTLEPTVLAACALGLLSLAALAALVPAQRAASIDPNTVLRED